MKKLLSAVSWMLCLVGCDVSAFDQDMFEGRYVFSEDTELSGEDIVLNRVEIELQGSIILRLVGRSIEVREAHIFGIGTPGTPGAPGRDGFGGDPDHSCAGGSEDVDSTGRPASCDEDASIWHERNVGCRETGARPCDVGRGGGPGGTGGPGPIVEIEVRQAPSLRFLHLNLEPGPGGEGGRRGLGMRHYFLERCPEDLGTLGPDSGEFVTCPDGGPHIVYTAPSGPPGQCRVILGSRVEPCAQHL